MIAAFVPFAALHLRALWYKPYFEHFPIVLICAAYLGYQRWARLDARRDDVSTQVGTGQQVGAVRRALRSGWGSVTAWLIAVLLLVSSVVLYSPWVGWLALCAAIAAVVIYEKREASRYLFAPLMLLLLLLPPPRNLDAALILRLQTVCANASSQLLDLFRVHHRLAGHVIELPGRMLMVEEACSGVNSLFVLIAASAVLVVWKRRAWPLACGLLTATVAWSVLANIARIFFVAWCYDVYAFDMSTGLSHTIVGFATLLLALGLIVSTDHLCEWFFAPIENETEEVSRSAVAIRWNAFARFIQTGHRSSRSDSIAAINPPRGGAVEYPAEFSAEVSLNRQHSTARLGAQLVAAVVVIFAVVFQVQLVKADFVATVSHVVNLSNKDLPETLAGWSKSDFEVISRSRVNSLGSRSCIWRYQSPQGPLQIAFDGPFVGWHELSGCYRHQGWEVTSRRVVETAAGPVVEVQMQQSWGEYALLLFSLLDDTGSNLDPPRELGAGGRFLVSRSRRTRGIVERRFGNANTDARRSPTTYQFQAFVSSSTPFAEPEMDKVRLGYQQFLEFVRQHVNSQ